MDSHTFLLLQGEVQQRHERDMAVGRSMLDVLIRLGNYLNRLTRNSAEIGTIVSGEFEKDKFRQRERGLIAFGIRFVFNDAEGSEIFSRTFPLEISIADGDFLIERAEVEDNRDGVTIPSSKLDSDEHLAKVVEMLDDSLELSVRTFVSS